MKNFIEVHDADCRGEVILLAVNNINAVTRSSHGGCWVSRKQGEAIHAWEEMDKIKQLIEEASK